MVRGTYLSLLRRPAALGALVLLVPFTWIPLIVQGDPVAFLDDLRAGTDPELARLVAWHLLFIVPPLIGGGLAAARSELEAKPFSWTLPGLQGRLRRGVLLAAVPVAAGCALVALHTAPAGNEVPMAAAGVAVGLFGFLSPLGRDGAFPAPVRWGIPLLWLTVAFRPAWVLGAVEGAPWVSGAVALFGAFLLVGQAFGPEAARARHLKLRTWGAPDPEEGRFMGWLSGPGTWSVRGRSPAHAEGRFLPWIRAASTEGTGGAGSALPTMFAAIGALVLYFHVLNMSSGIPVLVAALLSWNHLQLGSELLHPLSRRRRADLALVGALVQLASIAFFVVLAIALVEVLRVPTLDRIAGGLPSGWLPIVAATAIWAPLLQGVALWFPTQRSFALEPRLLGASALAIAAFVLSSGFAAGAMAHLAPSTLVALAAGISTLGYLALWRVIRHRYARIDLVRSTA